MARYSTYVCLPARRVASAAFTRASRRDCARIAAGSAGEAYRGLQRSLRPGRRREPAAENGPRLHVAECARDFRNSSSAGTSGNTMVASSTFSKFAARMGAFRKSIPRPLGRQVLLGVAHRVAQTPAAPSGPSPVHAESLRRQVKRAHRLAVTCRRKSNQPARERLTVEVISRSLS